MFELLTKGQLGDIPNVVPGQKQPPEALLTICSTARDSLVDFWIRQKNKAKAAKVYKEWLDCMAKYHCGHPDEIKRIEQARQDLLRKA